MNVHAKIRQWNYNVINSKPYDDNLRTFVESVLTKLRCLKIYKKYNYVCTFVTICVISVSFKVIKQHHRQLREMWDDILRLARKFTYSAAYLLVDF